MPHGSSSTPVPSTTTVPIEANSVSKSASICAALVKVIAPEVPLYSNVAPVKPTGSTVVVALVCRATASSTSAPSAKLVTSNSVDILSLTILKLPSSKVTTAFVNVEEPVNKLCNATALFAFVVGSVLATPNIAPKLTDSLESTCKLLPSIINVGVNSWVWISVTVVSSADSRIS